jgi:hypothetical protein
MSGTGETSLNAAAVLAFCADLVTFFATPRVGVPLVDAGVDRVDVVMCLIREPVALGGVGVAFVEVGVDSIDMLAAFDGVLSANGVPYFSLTTFDGVTGLP